MINQITIIGRLTRDAELKKNANDLSIVSFTIAVDSGKEQAYFFDCKAFGKTADNVERFVRKGDQICISGYLTQKTYETKDGQKRNAFEIVANAIEFLTQKATAPQPKMESNQELDKQSVPTAPKQTANTQPNDFGDDDLPF